MSDSQNPSQFVDEARHLYEQAREQDVLRQTYRDNAYLILGVAAGLGYIAGGGLATPFTRRVLRVGMKALFVPIAAAQLRDLALGSGILPTEEP